jgi:predicted ThiF/HesA family dinucleotide-utilizing enzyme
VNIKEWITAVRNGERVNHAVVLVGGRGSGKTVAIELFRIMDGGANHIVNLDARPARTGTLSDLMTRSVTEADVVVLNDLDTTEQLDAVKALVSADNLAVEIKGRGTEIRTVTANLILTTAEASFPTVALS